MKTKHILSHEVLGALLQLRVALPELTQTRPTLLGGRTLSVAGPGSEPRRRRGSLLMTLRLNLTFSSLEALEGELSLSLIGHYDVRT